MFFTREMNRMPEGPVEWVDYWIGLHPTATLGILALVLLVSVALVLRFRRRASKDGHAADYREPLGN